MLAPGTRLVGQLSRFAVLCVLACLRELSVKRQIHADAQSCKESQRKTFDSGEGGFYRNPAI